MIVYLDQFVHMTLSSKSWFNKISNKISEPENYSIQIQLDTRASKYFANEAGDTNFHSPNVFFLTFLFIYIIIWYLLHILYKLLFYSNGNVSIPYIWSLCKYLIGVGYHCMHCCTEWVVSGLRVDENQTFRGEVQDTMELQIELIIEERGRAVLVGKH